MKSTRYIAATTILAAVTMGTPSCKRKMNYPMTSGGVVTSTDGWWFSAGALHLEKGQPGVLFGMNKTPSSDRAFSYVVLFRHGNLESRGHSARVNYNGKTVSIRDGLEVNRSKFELALEMTSDENAGTLKVDTFSIDGKEIDLTKGKVFLVDLTSAPLSVKQIDVPLPKDLPTTGNTEVVADLARTIAKQVLQADSSARDFLQP